MSEPVITLKEKLQATKESLTNTDSNLLQSFSVRLNSCVHVSGNNMNGQSGYNHHNNNAANGDRESPLPLPDNKVPVIQPPRRTREYNWKLAGSTECSASCGKG